MNPTLDNLLKKAPKAKPQKTNRPEITVPDEVLEAFKRLVGADAVFHVAESRFDVEHETIKSLMLASFAEVLFKNGYMPANPRLTADKNGFPDLEGVFQVQTRYKITMPEEIDGNTDVAVRLLSALFTAGLPEAKAKELIENEIDCQPRASLRPFNELVNGHYEGEGKNRTFVEASDDEKAVACRHRVCGARGFRDGGRLGAASIQAAGGGCTGL